MARLQLKRQVGSWFPQKVSSSPNRLKFKSREMPRCPRGGRRGRPSFSDSPGPRVRTWTQVWETPRPARGRAPLRDPGLAPAPARMSAGLRRFGGTWPARCLRCSVSFQDLPIIGEPGQGIPSTGRRAHAPRPQWLPGQSLVHWRQSPDEDPGPPFPRALRVSRGDDGEAPAGTGTSFAVTVGPRTSEDVPRLEPDSGLAARGWTLPERLGSEGRLINMNLSVSLPGEINPVGLGVDWPSVPVGRRPLEAPRRPHSSVEKAAWGSCSPRPPDAPAGGQATSALPGWPGHAAQTAHTRAAARGHVGRTRPGRRPRALPSHSE